MDITPLSGGDFIMAKKGQKFEKYSKEKKIKSCTDEFEWGR